MLKSLLHWRIRAFEKRFDYDAAYLHEFAELDALGLIKFQRMTNAGEYAGGLPSEALCAARLAAALHEDCGPCAQVVINIALDAGVDPNVLTALAADDLANAPSDTALAFRFARAVLAATDEVEDLRAEVIRCFGARGPWALGLALSLARTYPLLKRATGHARACVRLDIGGSAIAPRTAYPA